MNLNEEIQKATDNFVVEKLPQMVEQKVAEMVNGILKDIFSTYGETAKNVKKVIEEGLDVNLQQYKLVDYNVLVADAINAELTRCVNEGSIQPIIELTKDIVGFVKEKEIKLSTIVQEFIDASMEDNETDGDGEISLFIDENTENKWIEVSIDIEAGKKNKEDCDLKFLFSTNKDRGQIFSMASNSWRDTLRKTNAIKLAQMSNLESQIFRLYSARVKIIADNLDADEMKSWSRYN